MDDLGKIHLILDALQEPIRLELLGIIAAGHPAAVPLDEVCARCGQAPRDVWPHLNTLRRAHLIVIAEHDGSPTFSIDTVSIENAGSHEPTVATPAPFEDFTDVERAILRTFIPNGRIESFPAQHKRQLVLWRYLVQRFEIGRDYPEAEVNDLLRPVNPDVATIRRALIDHGLMRREAGIYRRDEAPCAP